MWHDALLYLLPRSSFYIFFMAQYTRRRKEKMRKLPNCMRKSADMLGDGRKRKNSGQPVS